jgi:hypothetical protein
MDDEEEEAGWTTAAAAGNLVERSVPARTRLAVGGDVTEHWAVEEKGKMDGSGQLCCVDLVLLGRCQSY